MPRCLYLLFIFFTLNSFAAKPVKPAVKHDTVAVLKTDTAKIDARTFNVAKLNNYRKQPDFQYDYVETSPSWWTRLWHRFWHWFFHLFDFLNGKDSYSGFLSTFLIILKYLAVTLGITAIVYIILKLAGIDAFNIFRRKPASTGLLYDEHIENIHEIDFDAEIEKAITQHNYRIAVRLLYLKCLKQLNDSELIVWQPEKTNSNYINELNNKRQYNTFKTLTRQFEYIWYGEFPINHSIFNNINLMFQQFKNEI